MNPDNLITTKQIEETRKLTMPSSIVPEIPQISSFTATTPEMQAQTQEIGKAKEQQKSTLDSIFTDLKALGTQGATQVKLEEQAGIPTLNKELVDIENQLRQTDLDFRRQREEIQVTPGLTQAQMQARLGDVTRKQSSQLADLEVIRQARSNSLTNAQSLIDRKVQLEFADKQAKVDALKFIYDENKDLLSKEEDKLLSETIRREERAFDLAKSNFEQLENEKLQLVRNAQANGAGNSVMSAILGSKTLEDAYKNAGSFGLSIDDKIKKAQYSKLLSELGGGANIQEVELTGVPSQDIAKIINTTGAKSTKGIQDAIGVIKGLENLAGRNPEGTFIGFAPGIRFNFIRGGKARTERQSNIGDINAINLKVQQWASGASLTKQQEKQVKRLTPDKNDTDEQVKRKVNQLTEYMLGQVSAELASQGIQSTTPTFDFFNQQQSFTFDENGFIEVPDEFISNEQFFQ